MPLPLHNKSLFTVPGAQSSVNGRQEDVLMFYHGDDISPLPLANNLLINISTYPQFIYACVFFLRQNIRMHISFFRPYTSSK